MVSVVRRQGFVWFWVYAFNP